jgi:arginine/lysine/ornithine decarboxylase
MGHLQNEWLYFNPFKVIIQVPGMGVGRWGIGEMGKWGVGGKGDGR